MKSVFNYLYFFPKLNAEVPEEVLPKREVPPDVVVVVLPKRPPPVVEVLVEPFPNEKIDLFWFVFEVLPKRPPVEPVFVEVLPNNPNISF